MTLPALRKILILGAGELGHSIITSLLSHPLYTPKTTALTLLLRPSTLTNPSPSKNSTLTTYRSQSITLLPCDLHASSESTLTALFHDFDVVIHAGGMTAPSGTMLKITNAVIAAGVRLYMPWQHGVDYDVIGPEAGEGLFGEQCRVREVLRAQEGKGTQWVVVSCGMFMSFLFEEWWGVVRRVEGLGSEEGKGMERETVDVTALNSWETRLTVTTAEDIGRVVAEIVLDGSLAEMDRPVFIAGQTFTYNELADMLERVTGKEVVRKVWTLEELNEESRQAPEDKLWKYRVVFGEGRGISWPVEGCWSQRKGWELEGVEGWLGRNWK